MKKKLLLFIFFVTLIQFTKSQDFDAYVELPTTGQMGGVELADVNNDGKKDVVSSYDYPAEIKVHYQKNDHTFNSYITFPVGADRVKFFDIGDLNQDGLNDIVLTFGNYYGIFYQNTNGGFNDLIKVNVGRVTATVRIGDLNKDGINDIVFTDYNNVNILYQTTAGQFVPEIIPVTHSFGELRIADINNDQRNDLIFSSSPTQEICTFRQKSSGGFLPPVKTYTNSSMSGLAVGNLNADGLVDVVTTKYESGSSALKIFYPSLNNYIYYSYNQYPATTNADSVEIADLNNDGKNEIIVGNDGINSFSIYASSYNNYALIKNVDIPFYYAVPFQSLSVGDLNNDGLIDLAFAKPDGIVLVYNKSANLGATKAEASKELNLISNPVTDKIKFSENIQGITFALYSIDGKIISNGIIDYTNEIKTENLVPGTYFLLLKLKNGTKKTFKIIKK